MSLEGRVFITGGAGFLARAIYRRAREEKWECRFTAFSRDDAKHVALRRRFPEVTCIRGDVAGDRALLTAAMAGHDIVIHAAAVKYVDLAESNVFDTVRVNVHGSENVALAAIAARVSRVVGISTDKACQPVNVYGMTKAILERVFVEADRMDTATEFVVCRYGNVIGSTGSVATLFRDQLARDGQVSVTDPNMTRFWMPADDAVETIEFAWRDGLRGHIVVPTPRAAGIMAIVFAATGQGNARIVGIRPGEKLHEELIHHQESVRAKSWPDPIGERDYWQIGPPGEQLNRDSFALDSLHAEQLTTEELAVAMRDSETI